MKRVSLSLLLLLFAYAAFAADEPRVANVLIVDSEAWRTDLAIVAQDGAATAHMSDCNGFGAAYTVRLASGGGVLVPNVSQYQCSRTKLGVVKLPILNGSPRMWSQAHFRDAQGNTNVVMLPTLPDALPRSSESDSAEARRHRAVRSGSASFAAEYVFEGIENASAFARSTFVALIPDGLGKTQVELTIASYADAAHSVSERVTIDGFTFYELKTPVDFARLVVRHVAPLDYDGPAPGLFAVAFIGDRDGGSPRVEVPRVRFAASAE